MIFINVHKLYNDVIYNNTQAHQHNGHGWVANIYSACGTDSDFNGTDTIDKISIDDSSATATLAYSPRRFTNTTGVSNGWEALYGTGGNGSGHTGAVEKLNLVTDTEITLDNNWTGLNRQFKSSAASAEQAVFTGGETYDTGLTASWTRYLRWDDTVGHLGLDGNTYLAARSRAQCSGNGLDAIISGGVSQAINTAFGTTVERFRVAWKSGDTVFTTIFNTSLNFDLRNGAAVSSGDSYIVMGGRNLTANAVSTVHTKMPFDDTAITDIPTPNGTGTYVMIGGVMSGDSYYSTGGFEASGQVTKYKDSDTASATVFTNSMSDRQGHTSFGGY